MSGNDRPVSKFADFILKSISKNSEATRTVLQTNHQTSCLARVLGETNGDEFQETLKNLQETNLLAYLASKNVDKVRSGLQRFKSLESQSSFIDVEDISDKPTNSPHDIKPEGHWWEIEPSEVIHEQEPSKKLGVESKNSESPPTKLKEVTICVIDDARKKKDTFLCPHHLLLKEMPYFEKFLDSEEECEVQFSVHCDVEVFKRLLLFASKDEVEQEKFAIEPKYAIHMLVSAEFLQMNRLVDKCLEYCHENMTLLLSLSGIISLLNESLLGRLASLFKPNEIPCLDDPHDKIKSKLFRKLAEQLLNSPKLRKCQLCEKVFTIDTENHVKCTPTRTLINKTGEIQYNHKIDHTWSKSQYLQSIHTDFKTWEKTYWIMWGTVHSLPCCTCQKVFACKEYSLCQYHPEPAQFPEPSLQSSQEQHMSSHSTGIFPCCGHKVTKFNLMDPLQLDTGCSFRNHLLPQNLRQSEVCQILLANKINICLTELKDLNGEKEIDFKSLCKWNEDKISRPSHKATSRGSVSLSLQKLRISDDSKERSPQIRLLPGRSEHQGDKNQQQQLWNPSNSVWHNQDSIREYDYVGMEAVISHIKQH